MNITKTLLIASSLVALSALSGCIHVEDEAETRTTRTTTTSPGLLSPSTTTVERTTVIDD